MELPGKKMPPAPLPTNQIRAAQPTDTTAATRPTLAFDTMSNRPMPTWIQAVPSASAMGCLSQI